MHLESKSPDIHLLMLWQLVNLFILQEAMGADRASWSSCLQALPLSTWLPALSRRLNSSWWAIICVVRVQQEHWPFLMAFATELSSTYNCELNPPSDKSYVSVNVSFFLLYLKVISTFKIQTCLIRSRWLYLASWASLCGWTSSVSFFDECLR